MKRNLQSVYIYAILYFILCILSTTALAIDRVDLIQEGLDSIRNGRFNKALGKFEVLTTSDPSSPDGYFFISLSHFIHLIYNPEKQQLLEEFEKNLEQSISKGKAMIKSRKANDETALFLGTSYLLESYYKALQKEYFGSAFSARKGKKILEKILKKNPELYDAYFGLGIFNYYADKVPSLIKGLRFMLFLPGGDSTKGLFQLNFSSFKSKYFTAESSLILAEIYSSKHERDYYASHRELSVLIDEGKEYLLILHALARLEMKILNYHKASIILQNALARAKQEEADNDVIRLLQLHLAQCYFHTYRADKAVHLLENLIKQSMEMSLSMAEMTYLMAAKSFSIIGKMDKWEELKNINPQISSTFNSSHEENVYSEEARCNLQTYLRATKAAENGDFQFAMRTLENASLPCRKDERWILLQGEINLRFGKAKEALELFMKILHMGSSSSKEIKAVAELRAGNCFDILGKRLKAQEYYKRLASRSSPAREAAYFYLKKPFDLESYFLVQEAQRERITQN